MSKERRLGRGLEALLGRPQNSLDGADPHWDSAPAPVTAAAAPVDSLLRLSVQQIDSNPFQPRQGVDDAAIGELSESLQMHGLLQPLVVRRHGDRWQLIAGERRLRAAIKAGWSDVPVQVRQVDDRQMAEIAIVENLQRRDLNPLEKAASFQDYLERYGSTQEELASRLKIDRSTIANLIRLLELPAGVQDAVRQGTISQGHARALLPLGDETRQLDFCRRIQDESLSVRATEEQVQELIRHEDAPTVGLAEAGAAAPRKRRSRGSQLAALEQELRTALGTKVDVRQAATGRGKIVVHFAGADEFERLRGQLCEQPSRRRTG